MFCMCNEKRRVLKRSKCGGLRRGRGVGMDSVAGRREAILSEAEDGGAPCEQPAAAPRTHYTGRGRAHTSAAPVSWVYSCGSVCVQSGSVRGGECDLLMCVCVLSCVSRVV